MAKRLKLIIISDGTGETATGTARAAMKQFQDYDIYFTRYKDVRTTKQIDAIFEEAATSHDLVLYTIVTKELREYIAKLSRAKRIRSLDLLGPLLTSFSNIFDAEPQNEPGLLREMNSEYFERVDAIEFTINHDDGKKAESLHLADIVLVGISRTSKTPLSLYLSLHGFKTVNIPLIYGSPLPKEIKQIDQRKIFGLTIDPELLYDIRKNRLQRLGLTQNKGSYASMKEVIKEIEWANKIFSENKKWSIFNVTGKALEEMATEIMHLLEMRKKNVFKSRNG
ncbi:MAG: kinase/pyrophosphorylase [Bacteriovoracales bacterium]|nr:kinase/pyrophosphorylase [Bacteriovoracales bacterium]